MESLNAETFQAIRSASVELVEGLTDADMTVQSMPDASPAKWHLAHTTWFFETFILSEFLQGYACYDEKFKFLFNSYYESMGPRHLRSKRGLITRPSRDEVLGYRAYVDKHIVSLLKTCSKNNTDLHFLLALGLNHEQQHQELLLTDVLHMFAQNPLKPAYKIDKIKPFEKQEMHWLACDKNIYHIGHSGNGFSYDNETPRHEVLLPAFEIASCLVTNNEWLGFMEAGAYRNPLLWLSDGWAMLQKKDWQQPLYWQQHERQWHEMTLSGLQALDLNAPVRHVSYFEADAYARWAGVRLPTEFEWEVAMAQHKLEQGQAFDQVWQWTSSPYQAYPGYHIASGAVGEYNGKFMCNQFVLRGSSSATAKNHSRMTYRNFFYPHQRWQYTGLRLAR